MSGLINEVALPTYLATAATGAPATTAQALLNSLTPISFNFSGEAPGTTAHFGLDFITVNALTSTQNFFKSIISFSGASPNGITPWDLMTLMLQVIKDFISKKPITLTVTTNSSGVATVNLTTYAFPNVPNVQLCCQEVTSGQSTNAVITAVSTTSLSIKSYVTQNILLGIVNPVTPAAATVHLLLSYT